MHPHEAYELCRRHMHRYVRVTTMDGRSYDGIIAGVDSSHVILAIPDCDGPEESSGMSSEGYDYRYVQFFRRRRFFGRRPSFRRLAIPLFLISTLSLLRFF